MESISAAGASSSRKPARLHNKEEEQEEESSSAQGSEIECGEEPELPNANVVTVFFPGPIRPIRKEPVASASHQSNSDGSMIVSLTDPNVLNCDICYEPLSAPVFQCMNGHMACDQCCKKLKKDKCPSCRLPIRSLRCRAVEKILESIRVSCPNTSYGCNETSMSYSQKQPHETKCIYSPCSCPFANCNYQTSVKQLPLHFNKEHPGHLRHSFKYDSTFSIKLGRNVECIVLEENKEGDLFVITNYMNDFVGNALVVSRIIGTKVQRRNPYDLTASIVEPEGLRSTLNIKSFTIKHVPCKSSSGKSLPAGTFLVIPKDSFGTRRQVGLDLCIYKYSRQEGFRYVNIYDRSGD